MPNQLADFRHEFVHRLVRFAAIDFPLKPMPESLNRIVLRAIRRQMFQFQPGRFRHKRLDLLTMMDAAII